MWQRRPHEHVIERALERWARAGDGPGTLGVTWAGGSNRGRTEQALADLGVKLIAMPLYDEDGRVAEPLTKVDVLVSGGMVLNGPIYDQLACRMILRPYVGYNDIDVPAATERGILVCNVPDAYSEEVATQALAFLMAAHRQLVAFDRETRSGHWRANMGKPPLVLHNSRAQTVGVIGFGRIGRISGTRAKALGFRVIASDPYVDEAEVAELGIPLVPLEQLLREADYVTIHALLWEGTHHLLNAERMALMKPGAWLINTARGPIVDEAALVEALRTGRLAGAALDVFDTEPLPVDHPLRRLDGETVVLSPHVGWPTDEAYAGFADAAADVLIAYLDGREFPRFNYDAGHA